MPTSFAFGAADALAVVDPDATGTNITEAMAGVDADGFVVGAPGAGAVSSLHDDVVTKAKSAMNGRKPRADIGTVSFGATSLSTVRQGEPNRHSRDDSSTPHLLCGSKRDFMPEKSLPKSRSTSGEPFAHALRRKGIADSNMIHSDSSERRIGPSAFSSGRPQTQS